MTAPDPKALRELCERLYRHSFASLDAQGLTESEVADAISSLLERVEELEEMIVGMREAAAVRDAAIIARMRSEKGGGEALRGR